MDKRAIEAVRKKVRHTIFRLALCSILFALGSPVEAQQPAKVPRIAYLSGSFIIPPNTEAFKQGLHDLGYVEGKNIVIEWRFAERNRERLRALASELARLKVDVIVASGGGDTRAAKEATNTIPIVMAQADDPLPVDSSPAWRGPEATLPGSPRFPRN